MDNASEPPRVRGIFTEQTCNVFALPSKWVYFQNMYLLTVILSHSLHYRLATSVRPIVWKNFSTRVGFYNFLSISYRCLNQFIFFVPSIVLSRFPSSVNVKSLYLVPSIIWGFRLIPNVNANMLTLSQTLLVIMNYTA